MDSNNEQASHTPTIRSAAFVRNQRLRVGRHQRDRAGCEEDDHERAIDRQRGE